MDITLGVTVNLMRTSYKKLIPSIWIAVAFLYGQDANAQSLFNIAVSGTDCRAISDGSLFCKYEIGKDLEFSITSVGDFDTGISFLRSKFDGDYFARFGVMHGCIIVARGVTAPQSASPADDFVFVSPKTGKIYKSWQECRNTK